jgi:hypothetical protein
MTFTRRGFLGFLATSAVGACVAVKVPTAWLPEPVRRRAATEFLVREFNEFVRLYGFDRRPTELRAGRALFEAYEGEVVCLFRFTPAMPDVPREPSLCFKDSVMRQDATLPPWDLVLESPGHVKYARFGRPLRSAA